VIDDGELEQAHGHLLDDDVLKDAHER
jgi:hypothetical protein